MQIKMQIPHDIPKSISTAVTKECISHLPKGLRLDSKPTSIHDIIKPMYYASRMICLWPYKYEKGNRIMPLTTKSKLLAYTFLLAIIIGFCVYLCTIPNSSSQNSSFIAGVTQIVYTLLVHILAVFSIIFINSNFFEGLTIDFFIELESLSKFNVFPIDLIYHRLRRNLLLLVLPAVSVGFCIIILDMSWSAIYLPIPLSMRYASTYVVEYLMVIIFFQIYIKIEILRLYFQCLNENIRNSYLSPAEQITNMTSALVNFKCEQVKLLRLTHGKLCHLIHIHNDLHGWQIVILIFTISALVLNSLYPCFTNTLPEKYGSPEDTEKAYFVVREIAYISFYCFLVTLLAAKCSAAKKQALQTGLLAHEILLDLPIGDANKSTEMYKEQLQLLIEQISYRNPHFSAGGLFSVDYTTVYATANLITTNVIVLLEVNQAPTCNFNVNGTAIN